MKKTRTPTIAPKKNRLKRKSAMNSGEIYKILGLVGFAGLLAVMMVYAYNCALCADYFKLKHAVIRGCNKISAKEVKMIAGIDAPMNILSANVEKMKRELEKHPWIKKASVGRELPDRLIIELTERKATALLQKGKDLYIVDRDGVVFKRLEATDGVDLPVFTGFYRNENLREDLLKKAFVFLGCLSENNYCLRPWNVSEIYVDAIHEFSVYTDKNLFLNVGLDEYDKKLKRLKKVIADLARRGVDEEPLSIDLVDASRIVVQHGNSFSRDGLKTEHKTKI